MKGNFFKKLSAIALGVAMAIGIGVAVGSNSNAVQPVGAVTVSATFNKVTGSTLESGSDYIVAYDEYVLGNSISSNRAINGTAPSNFSTSTFQSITNPDDSIVWRIASHISDNKTYWTFYNAAVQQYLASTGSKNQAKLESSITDNSRWTLSASNGTFEFINKARAAATSSPGNKYLRNNGTNGWASYSDSTGEALTLYKKASTDKIDDSTNPFTVTTTPTVNRGAGAPSVSAWTVKAKLVGKAELATITNGLSFVATPSTATIGTISVTLRYTAASGDYPLNSGNATYDITTSMTVVPNVATVAFKSNNYMIAPSDTLTLPDEIIQSGDGNLTYEITSGEQYVSIENGVLTADALGTATIKVTKGAEYGESFKKIATTTISVLNAETWSYTFTSKIFDASPQEKTLNKKKWTATNNGDYYNYDGTKGQQFGSSGDPASSLSLVSSDFESYSSICVIKITTSGASSINATLSVKVGETSYKSGDATSVSITSTSTEYTFTNDTYDTGDISIEWSNSSEKAMYVKAITVIYDATLIPQSGIQASWDTDKGSYYNGNKSATNTFSTKDLIVNQLNAKGNPYGEPNTSGYGFKVYVKSGDKWLKTDKTLSDTEVVFLDASSEIKTQSMSGFTANAYSLYVTTPKETEGVYTSDAIDFIVIQKAPQTVTKTIEPTKTEYVAYYDEFIAYSGKINIVYNDTGVENNATPVIKYYENASEIDISSLLNSNNQFAVSANKELEVRLYKEGFVGGTNAYDSYEIYIYVPTLSVEDGNGEGAEYPSNTQTALNPALKLNYTDKDSEAGSIDLSADAVDLYIKLKNAEGDGTIYSGTMPEVNESTLYTITAKLKANNALKGTYDINVVNATFILNADGATKSFVFGANYSKTGLVVQIKYGTSAAIDINPENYIVEDENGNELDVIKFIGNQTLTVRYKGFSAQYVVSGTNVGSSTENIHDDIPGQCVPGTQATVNYQSATDTLTQAGAMLAVDAFDYSQITSNKTYNGLLNSSSYFGKNEVFNGSAQSITFSINVKVDTTGPSFAFSLSAITHNELTDAYEISTTYTATSSSTAASTSYKTITVSINDISEQANVTGWYIDVEKSGTGNNAQFSNISVTYTPYVKSPDQKFNATPREQALAFSKYFLDQTNGYCDASLSEIVKTKLATEYSNMVDDAKTLFTSGEVIKGKGQAYPDNISEALSRYLNMVQENRETNFLGLDDNIIIKSRVTINGIVTDAFNTPTTIILITLSIIGITAVGGYYYLKHQKGKKEKDI